MYSLATTSAIAERVCLPAGFFDLGAMAVEICVDLYSKMSAESRKHVIHYAIVYPDPYDMPFVVGLMSLVTVLVMVRKPILEVTEDRE